MIIRYAGRSVTTDSVSPATVRKLFEAHDVGQQLKAATTELITLSASGPSLALRRLREKVKRLERRFEKAKG